MLPVSIARAAKSFLDHRTQWVSVALSRPLGLFRELSKVGEPDTDSDGRNFSGNFEKRDAVRKDSSSGFRLADQK